MHKQNGTLLVFVLAMMAFLATSSVQAQGGDQGNRVTPNRAVEIRPDLGPTHSNGVVGEHGYKVFNPGAIQSTSALPLAISSESLASATALAMRTGYTDAWLAWSWSFDWKKWGWDHIADHRSESDMWEDVIQVGGRLKVTTDSGWRAYCGPLSPSGSQVGCGTSFFQGIPRTIKAETDHFFHKDGYIDDQFMSEDSA